MRPGVVENEGVLVCVGLVKLSRHARIQKLRRVRQELEDILNQDVVVPLNGPEQIMAQVDGDEQSGACSRFFYQMSYRLF